METETCCRWVGYDPQHTTLLWDSCLGDYVVFTTTSLLCIGDFGLQTGFLFNYYIRNGFLALFYVIYTVVV